jgi:hypothetical protein
MQGGLLAGRIRQHEVGDLSADERLRAAGFGSAGLGGGDNRENRERGANRGQESRPEEPGAGHGLFLCAKGAGIGKALREIVPQFSENRFGFFGGAIMSWGRLAAWPHALRLRFA